MPDLSRSHLLLLGGLLVAILVIGGAAMLLAGPRRTEQERVVAELQAELDRLHTVQGRLHITLQEAALEQELWVQRPNRLRTETAEGPSGFKGAIVVLNDQEGWVYSPALEMATVVDRAAYRGHLAGETGAGSLLERMPEAIVAALGDANSWHLSDGEDVAGRATTLLELDIGSGNLAFPQGMLQVWLDNQFSYPLAWRDSSGRALRFDSVLFNEAIDPATFTFFPPPGASVQRVEGQP
jgi:outer membrane lipoprotein-sorting protein